MLRRVKSVFNKKPLDSAEAPESITTKPTRSRSASVKASISRKLHARTKDASAAEESSAEMSKRKQRHMEEMEQSFNENLKYIISLESTDTTVADGKYARKLTALCQDMSKYSHTNTKLLTFVEYYKIPEVFILLLAEFYDCHRMVMIEYYGRKQVELFVAHKDHPLAYCIKGNSIFLSVIRLIYFCSESDLFNRKFNEMHGVSFLLKYIGDKEYWLDCLLVNEVANKRSIDVIGLLKMVLLICLNLTRSIDMRRNQTELVEFNKVFQAEKHAEITTLSFMILFKILSRKERRSLFNKNDFITQFSEGYIKTAAAAIKSKLTAKKLVLCDGTYCPVSLIDLKSFTVDAIELMEIVYNFEDIEYDRMSVYQSMRTIIKCGKDIELEYATKLLLQFSFISKLQQIMARDDTLTSVLNKILLYKYPNKRLLKYCDALLWRLDHSNLNSKKRLLSDNMSQISGSTSMSMRTIDPFQYNFMTHGDMTGKKIFMSHENYDSVVCKNIRNELEVYGMSVWLNSEEMDSDYSFEKTASAIRRSDLTIICKYMVCGDLMIIFWFLIN